MLCVAYIIALDIGGTNRALESIMYMYACTPTCICICTCIVHLYYQRGCCALLSLGDSVDKLQVESAVTLDDRPELFRSIDGKTATASLPRSSTILSVNESSA